MRPQARVSWHEQSASCDIDMSRRTAAALNMGTAVTYLLGMLGTFFGGAGSGTMFRVFQTLLLPLQ